MPLETNGSYDFGPFSLRVRDKTLYAHGESVELGPMGVDVLKFLIANQRSFVSRAELAREVWKAREVSDDAVYRQISDIRKSLDRFDDSTKYIETKNGRGWRFIGNVEKWTEPAVHAVTVPANPAAELPQPGHGARHKIVYFALACALAAVAGTAAIVRGVREAAPRITDWHKISNDGLPKDGRLLTDGRQVYFTEHVSRDANSDTRLAAVPVSGGDLTYPATPVRPATLVDIGTRTGDRLYSDRTRFEVWPLLRWRSKEGSLEATGLKTDEASISPDGRALAYGGVDNNLHIRDLGSSAAVATVPLRGQARRLRWSSDGKRIRFSVAENGPLTASLWEVWRGGSHLRQLPVPAAQGKKLWAECWTADGRYFIFSEFGELDRHSSLWIVADDSMGLRQAKPVKLSAAIDFRAAVAGPDGSAIFAIGATSRNELARFDFEKREFAPIWEGFPAIDIAFSHDGAWAAFARYPECTLWVSRADGSERKQIMWSKIEAHQPHWSPDGRRIAFMGQEPGKPWRIYIVNASGGAPEEVKPDDPFDQGVPSWSSDGRYLVFGELRDRKPDAEMVIRVLDLNTGTEAVLPGSKGKWSPRWSPDGSTILAQTTDFKELDLFDCKSQSWRVLTRALSGDATWSVDGKFVHFMAITERGMALSRVGIEGGKVEELALQPEFEYSWSGVAPDGSPLTLRAVKMEEIYALELRLP